MMYLDTSKRSVRVELRIVCTLHFTVLDMLTFLPTNALTQYLSVKGALEGPTAGVHSQYCCIVTRVKNWLFKKPCIIKDHSAVT